MAEEPFDTLLRLRRENRNKMKEIQKKIRAALIFLFTMMAVFVLLLIYGMAQ